jgi:hypothetical protein
MTSLIGASSGVQTRRMAAARENQQGRAQFDNEDPVPVEAEVPEDATNHEAQLTIAHPEVQVRAQDEGTQQLEAQPNQDHREPEPEQPAVNVIDLQSMSPIRLPEGAYEQAIPETQDDMDKTPTNDDNPVPGPSQVTPLELDSEEDSPEGTNALEELESPSPLKPDELWQSDSESSRFFQTESEGEDSPKHQIDQHPLRRAYGGYPHKPFPHGRYPHQDRRSSSPSETQSDNSSSIKRPGQKRAERPHSPTEESPPRNASAPDQPTGPELPGGSTLEPTIQTFRALRHLASHNKPGLKETEGGKRRDP